MDELLKQFLGGSPNSFSVPDNRRFIRYAFECARLGKDIDTAAFRKAGVTEHNIEEYLSVYSWVRDIYEIRHELHL